MYAVDAELMTTGTAHFNLRFYGDGGTRGPAKVAGVYDNCGWCSDFNVSETTRPDFGSAASNMGPAETDDCVVGEDFVRRSAAGSCDVDEFREVLFDDCFDLYNASSASIMPSENANA